MVKKRVSEPTPVQVYLAPTEHARLERLADRLATSKSEILRQGIRALERQVTDPEAHPTLRLIGLGEGRDADGEYNAAVEHDRFIAGGADGADRDPGPAALSHAPPALRRRPGCRARNAGGASVSPAAICVS